MNEIPSRYWKCSCGCYNHQVYLWCGSCGKRGGDQADRVASHPKPELRAGDEPLAAPPRENPGHTKRIVRVKSFRVRLCDKDNLSGGFKPFLDSLVRGQVGGLVDDSPQHCEVEIQQIITPLKILERTEITISVEQ